MTRPAVFPLLCLLLTSSPAVAAGPATKPAAPGPLTPAAATASFELEPGLAVDLVAAEPLVVSPCAVAWDERGRMYVAENPGYPDGGPGGRPVGAVALLEDTDGDGLPDRRTDFAAGLTFPNGVMPWRGGVIVTCSPDVLYLEDADGDGRAEVREVLLSGLATDKSTQLRANDPTLGPDGWVYLAGGLSGGDVYSPKRPDRKVSLARHDLKFRPDTGEIERVDGKGQFGLTFDDAGRRFVCNNRVQVQHAPLPSRYLARNPLATPPGVLHDCPDLVTNTLLVRGSNAGARIYPISANITTADSHAGTYSAACAVHVARGDALPAAYVGRAWSCDPTGNLVRSDRLVPAGGSFHARRVREGTEALRSRDDWFRPVFLADAPDGALYVCDMYRKTIEHPDYLPEEVRKRTDFDAGKDMGRIWRIRRTDAGKDKLADAARKNLALAGGADAMAALRSPNGWVRDTAFRLATERGDRSLAAALDREVTAGGGVPVATVIAAMNLLANRGAMSDAALSAALRHADPSVRENAVRLAEPRLALAPDLAAAVLSLAGDDHVHVRYAVALAAGETLPGGGGAAGGSTDHALARLALADADDKWFRAAILTSARTPESQWQLLARLLKARDTSDGVAVLVRDLARASTAGAQGGELARIDRLLETSAPAGFDARAAVLLGAADHSAPDVRRRLAARQAGIGLQGTIDEAARAARDRSAPPARRVRAAELLALDAGRAAETALLALVSPDERTDLAVAAVRGLAQPHHAAAAAGLVAPDRWRRYPPALRTAVIASLAARPEFFGTLLEAVEVGTVPAGAIDAGVRERLKKSGDETVRARAEKLFAGGAAGDRARAFEEAKAVLKLRPAPANGRKVFLNHCASCHRLEREGFAVGPDLFGIRGQPKEAILLHVVDPDREVAPNFVAYTCAIKDTGGGSGRTITGILVAEGTSSVTLLQPLGIEDIVPRGQIASLTASATSLMPQGLEKAMTPQDLADLLAYLRGEQ